MGQSLSGLARRNFCNFVVAVVAIIAWVVVSMVTSMVTGCGRHAATPATQPAGPRIASLVPAATDLLRAMHAGDRLVAVSNFDLTPPGQAELPRVGDYQNIDWEKLASLHPSDMIVQMAPDRIPPGLSQRADSLGIRLLNVKIDRLQDVYVAVKQLSDVLRDPAAAATMDHDLAQGLAAAELANGKPHVRTLIVIDPAGQAAVGRETFLDDLLTIAGGDNVVPPASGPWPTIDRETLLSLKPDVILQLLPDASPQVVQQAKNAWSSLSAVPAVTNHRVYQLTDWYLLQPGSHVTDTAKAMAEKIHP